MTIAEIARVLSLSQPLGMVDNFGGKVVKSQYDQWRYTVLKFADELSSLDGFNKDDFYKACGVGARS